MVDSKSVKKALGKLHESPCRFIRRKAKIQIECDSSGSEYSAALQWSLWPHHRVSLGEMMQTKKIHGFWSCEGQFRKRVAILPWYSHIYLRGCETWEVFHVTPRYPTLFTSARVSHTMTFLCMIVLGLIHFSELYHRPISSRVVCRSNPFFD